MPLGSHQPHISVDLLSSVVRLAGLLDTESYSKASMEGKAKPQHQLLVQAAGCLLGLNSKSAPCALHLPLCHHHYDTSLHAAAYQAKLTVACIKA